MALGIMSAATGINAANNDIIGKQNPKIENGLMTPEVLWSFGRIGGVQVSPDGTRVLYSVSYYSIPENKGNSEIFVMNTDGSNKEQITHTPGREAGAKWMKDGQHIAFLSSESGSMQLWIMKVDGSDRKQISNQVSDVNF